MVVEPSCAVPVTVIAFEPSLSEIEFEAVPVVTSEPFTVTVSPIPLKVGVRVIEETELSTVVV